MFIVYFDSDQFSSTNEDILVRLQNMTFDDQTHYIKDSNKFAFAFFKDEENLVKRFLDSTLPNLTLTFEEVVP